VAISETVKENYFYLLFLNNMGVEVEIPITVRCDNVGAIFMAENSSSGVRSLHIDYRYHFDREHFEDWFIKIIFADNIADVFTKSVSKDIYFKHANEFLGKHNNSNLKYWR
jgi:hypothetical protein